MSKTVLTRPLGEPHVTDTDDPIASVHIRTMTTENPRDDLFEEERLLTEILAGALTEGKSAASAPDGGNLHILEQIVSAFEGPDDWRTAWGIGNEIGYSKDSITEIIGENAYLFEVSPIEPAGIKLYRLRPTD